MKIEIGLRQIHHQHEIYSNCGINSTHLYFAAIVEAAVAVVEMIEIKVAISEFT